jgi:glycosyltransferase involved in cell wall biosynthesis
MNPLQVRIGIVKPDYNITGGFETVVSQLSLRLQRYGFDVGLEPFDARRTQSTIYGVPIPTGCLSAHPEFFSYMVQAEAFEQMDLSTYDVVVSTQPPSFAIPHPRQISLFYHHLRIAYDLLDVIQEIGLFDRALHRLAAEIIRETDQYYLDKVSLFLAGSATIKNRLSRFNHVADRTLLFNAGIDDDYFNFSEPVSYEVPICVGRHEFPKRPELFIHAMKHLPELKGLIIGSGGFTTALYAIDRHLSDIHRNDGEIDDQVLWKKSIFEFREKSQLEDLRPAYDSNISFAGHVSKRELAEAYQRALCVVCPAYEEDYGLTALEAMAFHKPVIVCRDGGGYLELVEDGISGLVVEPTGEGIAHAIRLLAEDPGQAKRMGDAGYEKSRQFSWENATRIAVDGIRRVLNGEGHGVVLLK